MSDWQDRILREARDWIGTPYMHQASLIRVGTDCLGLVRGVYRDLYGAESEVPPPYSRDWAEAKGAETLAIAAARHLIPVEKDQRQPGDVLLFALNDHSPAKHCAILSTDDRMIHAAENHPVAEVAFSTWWQRRVRFVFRFPPKG